jgi:hypothetical protein
MVKQENNFGGKNLNKNRFEIEKRIRNVRPEKRAAQQRDLARQVKELKLYDENFDFA